MCVMYSLTNFENACDNISIQEGSATWLVPLFNREPARPSLSHGATAHKEEPQKETR